MFFTDSSPYKKRGEPLKATPQHDLQATDIYIHLDYTVSAGPVGGGGWPGGGQYRCWGAVKETIVFRDNKFLFVFN